MKCYTNFKNSYKSTNLGALGESDHDMLLLLPKYKQKYKTEKPVEKVVYQWTDSAISNLQACLDITLWDTLCNEDESLEKNIDIATAYISFCVDLIVPKKSVRCFSNNKPWVTSDLKVTLNKKKKALANRDTDELKLVKLELKTSIHACKMNYKTKIETMFRDNKPGEAWS
jgi:hypothetical protein